MKPEVTQSQVAALTILRSLGECSAAEVARGLGTGYGGAYARLMALKAKGLVHRNNGRWTAA